MRKHGVSKDEGVHSDLRPSFETRGYAALLRMRTEFDCSHP